MVLVEDNSIGGWSQILTSSQCPECQKTLDWKPAPGTAKAKDGSVDPMTLGYEAKHCTHIFSMSPETARVRLTRDPKATVPTTADLTKAIKTEEDKAAKGESTGTGQRGPAQKAQEDVFNEKSDSSKDRQSSEKGGKDEGKDSKPSSGSNSAKDNKDSKGKK